MVCFAWLTLWAFLRIGTNPRVFERPLSTSEAETVISSWLTQPATPHEAQKNHENRLEVGQPFQQTGG